MIGSKPRFQQQAQFQDANSLFAAEIAGARTECRRRIGTRPTLAVRGGKQQLSMPGRGLSIKDFLVRGRIDWDSAEDGYAPLLVIDGREISRDQFGQMLMGFEGWQFKLEIRDRSEEI